MKYLEVSAKTVIAKVYRDLNLQEEERWHDMIEWIAEGLEFIGANPQFQDKIVEICITGHRGALPCDLHAINYVTNKDTGEKWRWASDQRHSHLNELKNVLPQETYVNNQYMHTYNINGNYLNAELREATVLLSYKGLPLDAEGFPMVPKEVSVTTALFWYIVKQLMLGGYVHPVITWQSANEEWNWYCGQARGKLNMPNLDQMEQIRKTMMRLIPQINLSQGYFTNQNSSDTVYE